MKKADILKKLEGVGDDVEFVFMTNDEQKTFLNNYKTQEVQKAVDDVIGGKLRDTYQTFEDAAYEITGLRKEGSQKASEFIKKLLADNKGKIELLEKQASGKGDEALRQEIDNLKKEHKRLLTEAQDSLAAEKRANRDFKVRSEISKLMTGLQFVDMPDAVKENFINTTLDGIVKVAEIESDGGIVFKNADGTIMKNDMLEPIKPADFVLGKLKPIIKEARSGAGAGGSGSGGSGGSNSGTPFILPAHVKTRTQLSEHLLQSGYLQESKEYADIYKQHAPTLKAEL